MNIGLVLSGGGVKGLAHLALLKKLDDLSIRPTHITGTSMGAIIGALYACGLSGAQIEQRILEHTFSRKDKTKSLYKKRKKLSKWLKVFSFTRQRGGVFKADGVFAYLFSEIIGKQFEDLDINLTLIATDFYQAKEVALNQGDLLSAVQASMAVPGVFPPVERYGLTLIDGGVVNNLPCNHIDKSCDYIIASNVISLPEHKNPGVKHVVTGALSIMLQNSTAPILKAYPPDVLFSPNTNNIDAFDFHKIRQVLDIGDKTIEKDGHKFVELRQRLLL